MASDLYNGCPLSQLVESTNKGYCGTCPQKFDCIFWTILRKLEDVEKQVNDIQRRVR